MNFSKNKINFISKIEKWYPSLIAIFIGFVIADLLIISYRHLMLPSEPPPTPPAQQSMMDHTVPRGAYNTVTSRNIFSMANIIPDALTGSGPDQKAKEKDPVLSQLPLKLIGTLVHSNPDKSLAAIELKGKNQTITYSPKKQIENMATVEKIERAKVYIRNLGTNDLEFIEMKQDNKITFGGKTAASSLTGKEIQNLGSNKFVIKRSDLMKYTKDLSSLLMQARAVPALKPGGEIYGFKILEMQQGSVYTQLGLMPMDVITGVNGNPVTSPAQAMEMYQALQSSAEVRLQVERNGKNETFTYSIPN